MNKKELSENSDTKLPEEAKNLNSNPILNAFFIGILLGIIIWSVVKNTWGLVSLIPLYFIYVLTKKTERHKS